MCPGHQRPLSEKVGEQKASEQDGAEARGWVQIGKGVFKEPEAPRTV